MGRLGQRIRTAQQAQPLNRSPGASDAVRGKAWKARVAQIGSLYAIDWLSPDLIVASLYDDALYSEDVDELLAYCLAKHPNLVLRDEDEARTRAAATSGLRTSRSDWGSPCPTRPATS